MVQKLLIKVRVSFLGSGVEEDRRVNQRFKKFPLQYLFYIQLGFVAII
ncbi:hypothetical protein CWATWH8502_4614 [Crocosphaera watsonii WH 8502]|uniref:Uncharacterized protein n=1 Tax=Crocosphaera watsonii WH 8502 TaxID=423474 RepID=T2ICJ1_CROWT|nr:hypothetical protein CWATWH8502_4614 [Crocosphaera watsonii WH 8502]